jgi:hypothetical protein
MRRKLDPDIRAMGFHARGQELQRIRTLMRTLVGKTGNACCWENYPILFDRVLPEGCDSVGDMTTLPPEVLLKRCWSFIRSHHDKCAGCPKMTSAQIRRFGMQHELPFDL